MLCGRVSCTRFKAIDCGHEIKPDEKCPWYENNGQEVPEVQKAEDRPKHK